MRGTGIKISLLGLFILSNISSTFDKPAPRKSRKIARLKLC